MVLLDVIQDRRLVILAGSGGVGKTTTSAAVAMELARQGYRTLCLTVDPAKRLADSLGLKQVGNEPQEVDACVWGGRGAVRGDAGGAVKGEAGSLHVAMLDAKQTFDGLVRQYSSTEGAAQAIFDNEIYSYVSRNLAHEYMAVERLYTVHQDTQWDRIVLDTPPTSNALDFLDAPQRLTDLLDSPATRWFALAMEGRGRFSLNLLTRGAKLLLQGLSKFTGVEFLGQLAQFISEVNALFGGVRQRAQRVSATLRGPGVGFVLVASPDPMALDEARYFRNRLREMDMDARALVVNSVHRVVPGEERPEELRAQLDGLLQDMTAGRGAANVEPGVGLMERLDLTLGEQRAQAQWDAQQVKNFRDHGGGRGLAVFHVATVEPGANGIDLLHHVGVELFHARSETDRDAAGAGLGSGLRAHGVADNGIDGRGELP